MLTQQQIAEFQKLYEEHFGITLSDQEALEKGIRLVRLLKAVLKGSAHHYKK